MERAFFMIRPASLPFLLLLLLLVAGCATPGDDSIANEWQALKEWSSDTARRTGDFFSDSDYRRAVLDSVRSWFGDVRDGLNSRSIEQIAAYAPEARQLAAWAGQYEALAPYGAWLAARVAYYEVASESINRLPTAAVPAATAPAPLQLPPPPRTEATITVRPARPPLPPPRPPHQPPPVAPPAPPALEQQRVALAASNEMWRERVAKQPLPSRATQLAPQMQAIFRDEGLPEELVWMAEVESTFNPAARSPAGAAGLFQLMPATARSLGLSTGDPDQRLDAAANGRAAARYLRYLHRRFDDWPLVFAAYNCGEGRVGGALKRNNATSYAAIAKSLPLETQMYVPRVQETIRLRSGKLF